MNPLKILNELSLDNLRKKFPSVPEHALPEFNYSDKDANGLTKCLIDFLTLKGHYAVRINTQGQYNERLKAWTKSTTRLCTSDVHSCIFGKHLSVEIKFGKDQLSEHQKATRNDIILSGGFYFVAKNFESFYSWYNELEQALSEKKTPEVVVI